MSKKEACNFICEGGDTLVRRFGHNAEDAACEHVCELFNKGGWEMSKPGDHQRTVVMVTDPVNMTVRRYVVRVTVEVKVV